MHHQMKFEFKNQLLLNGIMPYKHGIKVLFMTHSIIGLKFANQNQEIQTKSCMFYD
jgi:hypothetical protein